MAKRVQKPPRVPHAPHAAGTAAAIGVVRRFGEQQAKLAREQAQDKWYLELHPPKPSTPGAGWNYARTRNTPTL